MESAELCERFRALYMPVVCDTLYGARPARAGAPECAPTPAAGATDGGHRPHRARPGDEFDGVLVVPSEQAERVLLRAEEIVTSEEQVRREVAAGGTPMVSFDGMATSNAPPQREDRPR